MFRLTLIAVAVVTFAASVLGQTQHEPDRLESNFIELKVPATKVTTSVGRKIEIPVTLRNNFSNDVYLYVISVTDRLAGYTVEIIDSKGKTIEKTENSDPNAGGPTRSDMGLILPKEEMMHVLVLSDYYKLAPGRYTVFISALVHNYKRKESVWAAAKPIQLINN